MKHLLPFLFLFMVIAPVADAQSGIEDRFRTVPEPDRLRQTVERLAARPHHIGSAYDKKNAEWILAQFRSWGFDAHIETFHVLFPTPTERMLELVSPGSYTAVLREPPVPGDPESAQQDEQLPGYNAYSIDGDVTAPLVYVNYGIPSDYETLKRMGISVKGAIVIARYGASWRGIKPKLAAEHGAIGCIIYSDPRDDGYVRGDVIPDGPFRNENGIQRGSVMDMPYHPGDPLTPGVGATEDAHRLEKEESKVLTGIPVLPVSYGDAVHFLKALTGPVAPSSWRGGLPITYHIGPGPARVRLKLSFSWDIVPIFDVIATLTGSTYPDEWIIRGNHHDAWVNGAQDPVSGMAVVLEEARALGEMVKEGWRPKRTIVYCAWDGEEQGLLGSTEWVEEHAKELKEKAVLYLNTDSNGRGYLGVGGSHALEPFVNDVARAIKDPETGLTAWKRLKLRRISAARTAKDRSSLRSQPNLHIYALGSGSDYTAFFQHLGIPSLNMGYGGEGGGGVYHSIHDNVKWYTSWSDTSFEYGATLAQTAGTIVVRMADADILPFDLRSLAKTIGQYKDEVEDLLKNMRDKTKETNTQIEEGVFFATADPWELSVPPEKEPLPPHLNFAPLENAVEALQSQAARFHTDLDNARKGGRLDEDDIAAVNSLLRRTDQLLTDPDGLPRRPWFRHLIYAPGFYTGYGVKTLPGVREGIEEKKWEEAEDEIVRVGNALQNLARHIESVRMQFLR